MKTADRIVADEPLNKLSRIGVALLNWNGAQLTIDCVRSILLGTLKPEWIVVVDNASHDDSIYRLRSEAPTVILIQNSENRGFTGGNNQAISFLLAQGAEYIWVLNNDTVVDRNCLAELLRAAISSCPGAAFSAKIYYDMPPDRLWYAGAVRHRWHRAPIHLVNSEPLANTSENIKEVEFLSGCCIFASVEVWRKNGGFIQEYIAYSEDSDWCWRMQEAGLKSYYVPAALLWHKLSASVRKNTSQGSSTTITPAAMYLMVRNHLWTVRRHERVWWKRYFHICVNLGIQIRNVVRFSLTREVPLAFQVIRAAKDGLFFGVPGEYPLWKEPNE